ncbi:MAG: hypothetical protein Q8S33_16925 [Myxococcales bacterium]|nr:hypothetical protein [Myxococcales bacterium]MDP3502022.1 hypothetical protein [Myxococcales bacterium]
MGLGTFLFIGVIATLLGRAALLTLRTAGPWVTLACGVGGSFAVGLLFSALFQENAMDSVVHPIGPIAAAVGSVGSLLILNQYWWHKPGSLARLLQRDPSTAPTTKR